MTKTKNFTSKLMTT